MIPVDQTLFGGKDGNCFQACVASVLRVSLESVPHFMVMRGDWFEHFNNWMSERGLFSVEVSLQHEKIISCLSTSQWVILTGKTSRGCNHAVVARTSDDVCSPGFILEHDPHPSRAFFEGTEPTQVMFLGVHVKYSGYAGQNANRKKGPAPKSQPPYEGNDTQEKWLQQYENPFTSQ